MNNLKLIHNRTHLMTHRYEEFDRRYASIINLTYASMVQFILIRNLYKASLTSQASAAMKRAFFTCPHI